MGPGDNWSAGPVALTKWNQPGGFIEAGTQKLINPNTGVWERDPYWSYSRNNGVPGGGTLLYYNMSLATYKNYTVKRTTGNTFALLICGGPNFDQCANLTSNVDMGRSSYDHVGTGGEGNCTADPYCPIGFINSHNNMLHFYGDPASTWYAYCYTNTHNNVTLDGGTIGTCGPFPAPNWSINYDPS